MPEYNLLTQVLIGKGYDASRHPDYVQIPSGYSYLADPLDNPSGGFEYQRDYIWKVPFITGCGLYVMGQTCINDLGFMGINWCYENDNPVILCPYYKYDCVRNHALLRQSDGAKTLCFCVCHRANAYEYEKSLEFIQEENDEEKRRLYQEFKEKHSHTCPVHMVYDQRKKTWQFHYNPIKCASACTYSTCPVRGKPISAKKGNVFYDIKIKTLRKDDTFFAGQPIVSITKGKKFLPRPASIDICREIVKLGTRHIWEKEWWNKYSTEHLIDKDLEIEIINVHAEARESRDIAKDLEDIKNGIEVVHESDLIRAQKERKRARKAKYVKRREEAMQKKLVELGYNMLNASDQRLAKKLFTQDKLKAFEDQHNNAPKQISLFELY